MKRDTKYYRFLITMILISVLIAAASLISPILLSIWSQTGAGITRMNLCIILGVLITTMLLRIFFTVLRERFAKNYNIRNFQALMMKYFGLDYDYILQQGPTNILQRCQQAVNQIYSYMTGSVVEIGASILVLAVILVIMCYQNFTIAVVMGLMIPVNYLGYKLLNKELARRSLILQKENAEGFQKLVSYVGQTDYIKQCSDYGVLLEQMKPAMNQIYGSMADINVFAQGVSTALQSVNGIVQTFVMAVMAWDFVKEGNNPFSFLVVTILFPVYFSNLSVITNANLSKQGLNVSKDFIKEMEEQQESDGNAAEEIIDTVTLKLEELRIGEKLLAKKIYGTFQRGDVVWIQGESGCGKSTLAKLFLKMRPVSGIYLNGHDISELTNQSVRKHINYFSQNVPIIKGTLRENLFFNREWSREAEERILQEPVIQKVLRKHALDDRIEEGGSNLSGGEKQRIALVRAMYDQADVVIYDEVTSNIDAESAKEILECLMEVGKEKIVFLISHDEAVAPYVNRRIRL